MRQRALQGHGEHANPDYVGELDPVDASASDARSDGTAPGSVVRTTGEVHAGGRP